MQPYGIIRRNLNIYFTKVSSYQNLIQGIEGIQGFVKSLPLLVNINLLLKIVKCCNIFLPQSCVPKCRVCVGPKIDRKKNNRTNGC
jgi:hypothetical protein